MKKIIYHLIAIVLISSSSLLVAQDRNTGGIEFFEGTWSEAVQAAKKQNKGIFLDGYTSWCGPCKKMTKNVFTEAAVGKYYNDNFICVKQDMEKGEGVRLAQQFQITAYPTYVYLNSDGKRVHRSMGYQQPEQFIKTGTMAVNEDTQFYTLKAKHDKGKLDKKLIPNFVAAAFNANQAEVALDASNKHLGSLKKKHLKQKENMDFVMLMSISEESKAYDILLANKEQYVDAYGKEKVNRTLYQVQQAKVAQATRTKDAKVLQDAMKFNKTHMPTAADKYNGELSLMYYQEVKDWSNYSKTAKAYVPKYAMDNWNILNSIAWTFYEHVDCQKSCGQATDWAKKSMEIEENYYNTDTYAALLFKSGQHNKAQVAAKKAIKLAEADGMEAKETKALLAKIEAQLNKGKADIQD